MDKIRSGLFSPDTTYITRTQIFISKTFFLGGGESTNQKIGFYIQTVIYNYLKQSKILPTLIYEY